MEQIAILFPSEDSEATEVALAFLDEYQTVKHIPQFFPVLYNEKAFMDGQKLKVSAVAPVKTMFCIRRGHTICGGQANNLLHSLKRCGYQPAIKFCRYCDASWPDVEDDHIHSDCYCDRKPEVLQPYHRYERKMLYSPIIWGTAWFPDIDLVNSFMPAVLKTDDGVIEDENGRAKVFRTKLTWEEFDDLLLKVCDVNLDDYTNTFKHSPLWLEKVVDIEEIEGVPCEWRVFCYGGKAFYMTPKHALPAGVNLPRPSEQVMREEMKISSFRAIDFALDKSGKWWVLKNDGAEISKIPSCGSVSEFYTKLAEAVQAEDGIPKFCYALVADIVEEHKIGSPARIVKGSRHFRSGETVVYADGFWGDGAERSTVIGVPKYSDYPVAVSIATQLLTNFRVEKITDERFLKAIFTGRLKENFEKERKTLLSAWWFTPKRDLRKLNEMADMFNLDH